MKKIFVSTLLVSLMMSSAAMAEESAELAIECNNAMSTIEMKICAGIGYEQAEQELNATYKKILKNLEGEADRDYAEEAKKRLISSQEAWSDFKTKNAELSGIGEMGGSIESLTQTLKATEMTTARTKELILLFK